MTYMYFIFSMSKTSKNTYKNLEAVIPNKRLWDIETHGDDWLNYSESESNKSQEADTVHAFPCFIALYDDPFIMWGELGVPQEAELLINDFILTQKYKVQYFQILQWWDGLSPLNSCLRFWETVFVLSASFCLDISSVKMSSLERTCYEPGVMWAIAMFFVTLILLIMPHNPEITHNYPDHYRPHLWNVWFAAASLDVNLVSVNFIS